MEMNSKILEKIKNEVSKVVVGKEDVVELLTVALLSRGHVLLEGVPGVAKTTIAKTFSDVIGLKFTRIQLTPDLMPADIIGSVIYDQKLSEFRVRKGPIFANIVLADEINRASPKTQSALLEAMQERQVTIEGTTYKLDEPFLVIATMNPVEHEGVYALPSAQLDRFIMRISIDYPEKEEELNLLRRKHVENTENIEKLKIELSEIYDEVKKVAVSDAIFDYIYEIVSKTRNDERVRLGASPRAAEHLLITSKSLAYLRGRDYVVPDDVKELAHYVLSHRIIIKPEYGMEGLSKEGLIKEIVDGIEVPK
jgi:MoxR-like ATPase